MLTETKSIDKIEILENGIILVREAIRILKDNVKISETYHRTSFIPGQNLTGIDQKIIDVANLVWTPEVIAAFQEQQAEILLKVA